MNIDEALAAIANLIQTSTGTVVQVGRPLDAFTGLVLWPWRIADVSSARNNLPTHRTAGNVTRPQAIVEISFLLLASNGPANAVLQAHRTLLENPVVNGNGNSLRIAVQQLSIEELAAIFTAAQMKLSLCSNYALQLAL
jgi:hypothetical protein